MHSVHIKKEPLAISRTDLESLRSQRSGNQLITSIQLTSLQNTHTYLYVRSSAASLDGFLLSLSVTISMPRIIPMPLDDKIQ